MKRNETPDILSRIRNMKFRKELTALLAFFVMISTSYVMIHPGEALNNNVARSFMFFEEEQGTEEENKGELINAGDLLDKEREAEAVYTDIPAAEENTDSQEGGSTVSENQSTQPADQNSYPPTSTPAESVTPVFDSTSVPVVSASTEPEVKETSEPTGSPESLVSASPESSENTETADPENSPSASPDATESTDPSADPEETEEPKPLSETHPAVIFKNWDEEKDGIENRPEVVVVVDAPEGALPKGTKMEVTIIATPQEIEEIKDQVAEKVDKNTEVKYIQAVDITFKTADGTEIEPLMPIKVSMKSDLIKKAAEEENTETDLIHIKEDKEKEVKEAEKVEHTGADSDKTAEDEITFESASFSVYVIVGTEVITVDYLTADGETYTITVQFDERENLSKDMSLEIAEILEGTSSYNEFLDKTKVAFGYSEDDVVHFGSARFFDIIIVKDGDKYEPEYPAKVTIEYDNAIQMSAEEHVNIVHFADDGVEIISDVAVSQDNKVITYEQDSFSVVGTVTTTPTEGWPANGDYIMIVTSNNTPGRYYAVSYTGRLMEVEYNTQTREVTFPYYLRTDQLNNYTWTISGQTTGQQRQVRSNGWYLAPGQRSRIGNYYSRVPLSTTATTVTRTNAGNIHNGATNQQYVSVISENTGNPGTNGNNLKLDYGTGTNQRAAFYFASKSSFKVDGEIVPGPDDESEDIPLDDIGDEPGHSKKLIDNENGTYTLSLDVEGKADSGKGGGGANVIIVYDYSGSMSQTMAGGNQQRIVVARNVVRQLVNDLIPDPATESDKIWFNLVPFSSRPATVGAWTNNKNTFIQRVDSYNPSAYTDWTGAMRSTANLSVPDNGFPTYVIFVTDGQPSGYTNSNNQTFEQSNDPYHSSAGTSDVTDPCYYNAIPYAQQLVEKGYNLYGVFIGSDDTNMVANLIHDAGEDPEEYSYKASTVSAFEEVFAKISAEIKASISFDEVAIIDTMTDATSSTVIAAGATAEDYAYFITKNGVGYEIVINNDGNITAIYNATIASSGKATRRENAGNAVTIEDDKGNSLELVVGNPFPKAGSSGDTVTWDIGELGVLLNDYSYTVQFVVWPNQDAYDTVAGLNNGTIQWSQVDQTQYTRNTTTTPTSYGLRTNIEEESKVTFKKTKITQTGDDDPVIEEETGSSKYTPPTPVPLVNHKISVEKTFEDTLYGTDVPSTMQVVVNRDTVEFATIDLTKDGNVWKGELFIAPGLKVDGEILDTGYDYSVVKEIVKDARGEDISYRYELISGTFHPMLIDSATVITDETGQTGTLKAENHSRGYLELKKEIQDITDTTTEFTLDITRFVDKDGNAYSAEVMSDIWGVIYTGDDPYASGSSATWHPLTYWFDSDKNAYSVVLKQGETFRIGSVPVGTQYTVTETDVPSTYELVGFREDTVESGTTSKGQLNDASSISGSVDKANKGYIAVCVNKLAERGVKIRKTDNAETPAPLKNAVFSMVINNTTYVLTSNDEGYLEFTGKIVDGEETALDQNDPSGVLTSLKVGNYVLNETNPPAGYIALDGRVAISVGQTVTADIAEVKAYDAEDQEITDTETPVAYYVVFVTNAPGKPLPHTGGYGTLPYTLGGLALIMASALMYGFRMRRRERRLN